MIQKEFIEYECHIGQACASGFGSTNKTVKIKMTFVISPIIADVPRCVSFYAKTSVFE
jgi:hypothetical protein